MRNNLKIASHKLIIFTWKAIEAGVMNNLKREHWNLSQIQIPIYLYFRD